MLYIVDWYRCRPNYYSWQNTSLWTVRTILLILKDTAFG